MKGNTCDFTSSFNALSIYLKAFAYKLTKDTHRAEDLYQDTALLAYKHRGSFVAGTNMKAWLSTIMRNAFINKFRKKQRRRQLAEENQLFDETPKTVNNHAVHLLTASELESLVDSLKEHLKEPFLLAAHGYKYKEISSQMQLPLGTVKSRIFEARKQLKIKISELYGQHPLAEIYN